VNWRIALLIASAIAISYFDRQTLPIAINAIEREIPVSNSQFSQLQAAFLLAYAAMYAGGGKLIDVLGTRTGFLLIMVFWSLACASHGFATGFGMLASSRFLLGMGEGGGFPAATKAVAEWYPVEQRGAAMGIINAGTAVGSVLAPPGIALVIATLNWRWVFFLSGAIGLLWTLWWGRASGPPPPPSKAAETEPIPWLRLLTFPQVWGLVTAKFLSDSAWYFYLFWLPKYLYDVRGFDTRHVGYFAWIPYAASGVGSLSGGWFTGRLLARGRSLDFSRKAAMGASVAVMPLIFFVTRTPVQLAIVLFSLAFAGQQSWSTLVMILPADLFPRNAVGSVAGMVGFGGAIGGVVFGLVVGYLLDHGFGYQTVFAIVSTLHVTAFGVVLLSVREVRALCA
jgi:ACS family hexuronate transporter-like MFS transporter